MVTAYSFQPKEPGARGYGMDWKQFGKYVKRQRQDLELTQDDIAARWGKSQTTVSAVEKGDREVPREEIKALSLALERPVEEVWQAAGYSLESLEGFRGKEVVHIASGMRAFIIAREGESGTPLDLDDSAIEYLMGLAAVQKRRREGK